MLNEWRPADRRKSRARAVGRQEMHELTFLLLTKLGNPTLSQQAKPLLLTPLVIHHQGNNIY